MARLSHPAEDRRFEAEGRLEKAHSKAEQMLADAEERDGVLVRYQGYGIEESEVEARLG